MKKYIWRAVGVIVVVYFGLVLVRMVHFYRQGKTDEQVAKIHATKLTIDDVMGKGLSTLSGVEGPDAGVVGLDVNKNGIRDDVELAIFKAYPNSARTRAVLLQYALALQMEMTQPIVNTETVTAGIEAGERADSCLANTLVPRKSPESSRSNNDIERIDTFLKFVEDRQINSDLRRKAHRDFYKLVGSHTVPIDYCDLDILVLPN